MTTCYLWGVPHPVQEYTIMRVLNKRYQANTVRTLWGNWSASASKYLSLDHFGKYNCGIRDFSVLDKLVRLCISSQHPVFPLPWWYFPVRMERFKVAACTVLRVEVIIFSCYSRGLSLIERNLKKWILSTKSSCIRR